MSRITQILCSDILFHRKYVSEFTYNKMQHNLENLLQQTGALSRYLPICTPGISTDNCEHFTFELSLYLHGRGGTR
jgi:hypothetical protein